MKFKIIGTVIMLTILFILYVLFSGPSNEVDENGMPVTPASQQP